MHTPSGGRGERTVGTGAASIACPNDIPNVLNSRHAKPHVTHTHGHAALLAPFSAPAAFAVGMTAFTCVSGSARGPIAGMNHTSESSSPSNIRVSSDTYIDAFDTSSALQHRYLKQQNVLFCRNRRSLLCGSCATLDTHCGAPHLSWNNERSEHTRLQKEAAPLKPGISEGSRAAQDVTFPLVSLVCEISVPVFLNTSPR